MTNDTMQTLATILNNLRPTTLAAIVADIASIDTDNYDVIDFGDMCLAQGHSLTGPEEFESMISEAIKYVG